MHNSLGYIARAEDISLEQITILRQKENINYIEKNKGKKPYTHTFNREKKCRFCGKIHNLKKELCPAYGKTCTKCGRKNYFKFMCKYEVTVKVQRGFNVSKKVNDITTVDQLPKCETITLKIVWGSLIKFHIDNGSAVNILPI